MQEGWPLVALRYAHCAEPGERAAPVGCRESGVTTLHHLTTLIHVSLDVPIKWAFTQAHGAVFGR